MIFGRASKSGDRDNFQQNKGGIRFRADERLNSNEVPPEIRRLPIGSFLTVPEENQRIQKVCSDRSAAMDFAGATGLRRTVLKTR